MNVFVHNCLVCESELVNKRADALFCSVTCGNRFRNRKFRDLNPQKIKEKRLKDNSDVERRIFSRIKSKAKINNIPFDLERSDIIVPKFCPVLGIELIRRAGYGRGYHDDSPSLDRIKPSLGYVKGNVRVISARANLLKNNATVDELSKVLEDLKSLESS